MNNNIPQGWQEVSLSDVVSKLGDGLHGTPKYDEAGDYYFVNGNNLDNGNIVFSEKTKRVSREEYDKHKKGLNDRTILVSINGTLGNVAFYKGEKIILGKSACYFNVNDNIDKLFIKYVMSSSILKDYMERYATGTTIKNVSLKSMREFSFAIPEDLTEQERIADVLSSLDDRIENCRAVNDTLEQMAQALFKSWFVDFEPVHKLAEFENGNNAHETKEALAKSLYMTEQTLNLFPSKFEKNVLPMGWREEKIGALGDICTGKTPPTSNDEYYGDDVQFLTIPDMHGKIFCVETNKMLSLAGANSQQKKTMPVDSIAFSCIATQGLTVLIHKPMQTNQQINTLMPNHTEISPYLYFALSKIGETIKSMASGGVVANMNKTDFSNLKIIMPTNELEVIFSNAVKGFLDKILKNEQEIQTLTETRNTLLPKLISGEIRVNNPDLPSDFIKGTLEGLEQAKKGKTTPYEFG